MTIFRGLTWNAEINLARVTTLTFRALEESDSLEELTRLLHRAYARSLAAGQHFVAATQSVETTRERCERGQCYVAEALGALIATATLYSPDSFGGSITLYSQTGVFHFGQFAVDPSYAGQQIGEKLLLFLEGIAKDQGATHMALDTSENSAGLIAYYQRLGYEVVGRAKWHEVNYESVVMSKKL